MEAKEEEQALLLKASAEGDVAAVRTLLERGDLDVDGRDAVRFEFLVLAAGSGSMDEGLTCTLCGTAIIR
jgi:hypothetical protein